MSQILEGRPAMNPRSPCSAFILAISLAATVAQASTSARANDNSVTQIRIGQSVFELHGPWKFTIGDSPLDPKTGQPLWAEPRLDDSKWETVDLTPPAGSYEPITGSPDYAPGWTAKGHPNYRGYAWYRIRIELAANAGQFPAGGHLALEGSYDYDTVFQVFANGRLLGGFGNFSGQTPVEYFSEPTLFFLPQEPENGADVSSDGNSTIVIAFRVYMGTDIPIFQPDAGGLHNPPLLGDVASVTENYRLRWLDLVREYSTLIALSVLFICLGMFAFTLAPFDRTDPVYAWMGAMFIIHALYVDLTAVAAWTTWLSVTGYTLLATCGLFSLNLTGWSIVWWIWFGRTSAWIPYAAAALALSLAVSEAIAREVFANVLSSAVAERFAPVSEVVRILIFAILLWIVIQGIRRQGLEGWLVLTAILLRGISIFTNELTLAGVRLHLIYFGVPLSISSVSSIVVTFVVAMLLIRRLQRSIKAQRELALDFEQAREVQQVILPKANVAHPGLAIESVYRPAREVGGDFFQIIPHPSDSSVLIVAGDVAGKGLRAGMIVALLIGAVRMAVEVSADPLLLLKALNRRLLGQERAYATCLALRIASDGLVTLANAGHLPPYINAQPVAMEPAIPLGMFEDAEPSVMKFILEEQEKLVLISDGIPEATDSKGEFFGCSRIQNLLYSNISASALADAAQSFGQEDDICVISVTRCGKAT
jgi:hypothetical protein